MKIFNYQDLIKTYIVNKRLAKREKDPVQSLNYENKANSIRYVLELNSPTLFASKNHKAIMESDREYLQDFDEYAPFVRMFADIDPIEVKYSKFPINSPFSRLMLHTIRFYQKLKTKY
jgi:hypothetical protein